MSSPRRCCGAAFQGGYCTPHARNGLSCIPASLIATGDRDLLALHPWRDIQILNAADVVQHLTEAAKLE